MLAFVVVALIMNRTDSDIDTFGFGIHFHVRRTSVFAWSLADAADVSEVFSCDSVEAKNRRLPITNKNVLLGYYHL